MTGILSKRDIRGLLEQSPPLVEGYVNLEEQLQPNGIDLSLLEIALLQTPGQVAASNSRRIIPGLTPLEYDQSGFISLKPGVYVVTYNEVVHMPDNVMALASPRSSLLRCGVTIHTAVWDAGYSGRSQSLMMVYNPEGFRLQRNARIIQLVFFPLSQETEGYRGVYQNENT